MARTPQHNPRNGKGMRKGALTDKQEVFAHHYVKSFNAKRAAEAAGVPAKYSASTACNWLNPDKFPQVSALVAQLIREQRDQCVVDSKRIVEELVRIALFNPKRMFTVGGVMIALHELPDEIACAISEFETYTKYLPGPEGELEAVPVLKVKFHSKLGALQELAKHLGYLSGAPQDDSKSLWDRLVKAASEDVPDIIEAKIAKALGHDTDLDPIATLPPSEPIDSTEANAVDDEVDTFSPEEER